MNVGATFICQRTLVKKKRKDMLLACTVFVLIYSLYLMNEAKSAGRKRRKNPEKWHRSISKQARNQVSFLTFLFQPQRATER